MPIKFDYKSNGVILWHEGVITDEMLLGVNEKIYSHSYREGMKFQLMDLSQITEFKISTTTMNTLADEDRESGVPNVFACVVAPENLPFGLSRIWSTFADGENIQTTVVRSLKEAVAWFESNGIKINIEKSL